MSGSFQSLITGYAANYGVPGPIALAVAQQESGMGTTGRYLMGVVTGPYGYSTDPTTQADAGTAALARLYGRTGSWEGALSAYGPAGDSTYAPTVMGIAQQRFGYTGGGDIPTTGTMQPDGTYEVTPSWGGPDAPHLPWENPVPGLGPPDVTTPGAPYGPPADSPQPFGPRSTFGPMFGGGSGSKLTWLQELAIRALIVVVGVVLIGGGLFIAGHRSGGLAALGNMT